MLIWVGEPDYQIITAVAGTGDNLTDEDIKDGFVDYFMTSVYEQDGEELKLVDSGQLLTSTPIKDMDTEDKVERVLEYWEVHNNNYAVLEM